MATVSMAVVICRSVLLIQRPLADRHVDVGRGAAAQHLQCRGLADAVWPKQPHDVARALDRSVVPTGDDVADQEPGFGRRSVRVDAHNQYAGAATVLTGHTHVLQTGAQIAAP